MASQRSTELKVGVFFVVCLGVAAGMILLFGGRARVTRPHMYTITVVFQNAAGIVKDAKVMYGGIGVGAVQNIQLDQEGMLKVNVQLAIYNGVKIRQDAKFVINQSGLLGDRYVDVIPQSGTAPILAPGGVATGTSSVDLSEAIRAVVDVLKQTAGTMERVDKAVQRIDETVLSAPSLGHVTAALANLDATTSNTVALTLGLRKLVDDNRARVDMALTQFAEASANFNHAAQAAEGIVRTNQDAIRQAMTNVTESAERLNAMLTALQQGQGTAGKLLVDPTLYDEATRLIQNLRQHGLLYKGETTPAPRGRTPVPARPAKNYGSDDRHDERLPD